MILNSPYLKGKGYCPNPVVVKGIPKEANSALNPNVIGTVAWEQYWTEQLNYCLNGYQTGGLTLPGRYYYYMNFTVIGTDYGPINPDPTDLHLEYALYIEHCKLTGKNLICAKGRRRGMSEASQSMIVDYGWRFQEGYKVGVAAGSKIYIDDFIDKWKYADSMLPPELSTKKLTFNDKQITAGYEIKNQLGTMEKKGSKNTIYLRTMHTNPNMFKGLYLSDIVVEEVGEFEKFLDFYTASRDTLKAGNVQKGSIFAYGTGGQMDKGSKDFKKVWYDAETYNFVKFLVPATRFYFYGGATDSSRNLPFESDLYKIYKPYQLLGYEDLVLAEKDILKNREKYLKLGNLKEYNEDLQNNPLNETEIFRRTVINDFDLGLLNNQQAAIDALTHPKWTKYKLDWVKDDKGMIKMPLEVRATPIKPQDNQDECVWIIDGEFPRKNYQNLYVAGIDSYDQDVAKASKSLGAMCVLIRDNTISGALKKAPVAVISCRPKRKELFYELCMKLSVFYPLQGNVLGDVATALIMNHFRDNGLWHYLSDRPRKFESEKSEQTHEKWVRFTNFSRPRRASLMQSNIVDHIQDVWFGELIKQLSNFDVMEIGSDNDLADAYGIALMQDVSCEIKPRDNDEESITNRFDLPEFVSDGQGGMKMKQSTSIQHIQQDENLFNLMFGSDWNK